MAVAITTASSMNLGAVKLGALFNPSVGLLIFGGLAAWQIVKLNKRVTANHTDLIKQLAELKSSGMQHRPPADISEQAAFFFEQAPRGGDQKGEMFKDILSENMELRAA
ncbi:MAG: hypothetical protein Q9M31_00605 [Mariprofundus sp.]|nr:hypothetical protein [Mariprofundus sp.]